VLGASDWHCVGSAQGNSNCRAREPSPDAEEAKRRAGGSAKIGQQLIILVNSDRDIETALQLRRSGADAVRQYQRFQISIGNAPRHTLPASFAARETVAGGLMSYGTSLTDALRQVGSIPVVSLGAKNRPICPCKIDQIRGDGGERGG
jgi:hypothetical protein